jgi:hypothetical protein
MICNTQHGFLVDVKEKTYYIFLQDGETSTRRGIKRKDYKEGTRDGTILVEQGGWVSMSYDSSTSIH